MLAWEFSEMLRRTIPETSSLSIWFLFWILEYFTSSFSFITVNLIISFRCIPWVKPRIINEYIEIYLPYCLYFVFAFTLDLKQCAHCRGGSRAAATSKMDVAAALDPPLHWYDRNSQGGSPTDSNLWIVWVPSRTLFDL